MQLEQSLEIYHPMASRERQTTYFVVGDLESLSASALYTGDLPPMGPSGCGALPSAKVSDVKPLDIPMFGISGNSGMSFIDLPSMNLQAHCHEGANGTTHFMNYDREKIQMLDSYQFAMGDLYAKNLGLKSWIDYSKK